MTNVLYVFVNTLLISIFAYFTPAILGKITNTEYNDMEIIQYAIALTIIAPITISGFTRIMLFIMSGWIGSLIAFFMRKRKVS